MKIDRFTNVWKSCELCRTYLSICTNWFTKFLDLLHRKIFCSLNVKNKYCLHAKRSPLGNWRRRLSYCACSLHLFIFRKHCTPIIPSTSVHYIYKQCCQGGFMFCERVQSSRSCLPQFQQISHGMRTIFYKKFNHFIYQNQCWIGLPFSFGWWLIRCYPVIQMATFKLLLYKNQREPFKSLELLQYRTENSITRWHLISHQLMEEIGAVI